MASAYNARRRRVAKKARAEFLEFVDAKPGQSLDQTMRLIDYMVTRMGFSTVITEQMPNWLLGHMTAFARREVDRDRKRAGKERTK